MDVIKMTHSEMKSCLVKNANLFYNGYSTEVNDAVYDSMMDLVLEDEPGFNIYDYIKYTADGVSVEHTCKYPEFTKEATFMDFDTKAKFEELRKLGVITPKFDGSSVVVYFKDGELERVVSRGDDKKGFLNTNKLKGKVSDSKNKDYYLAEAVVSLEDGGRAKANGLINSRHKQEDVDKYLTLIPFDYQGESNPDIEVTDYKVFERLRAKGEYEYQGKVYPCDGVVVYPNKGKLKILKRHYSEIKLSNILDVKWDPSENSGVIHPVAIIDTVELDGTNVSKVSLGNYEQCVKAGIHIGQKVSVIKANMTIPQIYSFDSTNQVMSNLYMNNLSCDHCGSRLVRLGNDVICAHPNCSFFDKLLKKRILELELNNKYAEYLDLVSIVGGTPLFTKSCLDNVLYDELTYLDICAIPRLSATNKKGILDAVKELGDVSGLKAREKLEKVASKFTASQYNYFQIISLHLEALLVKLFYALDITTVNTKLDSSSKHT